ncbi:uncharacterized protein LOC129921596 isoform X2 [Biomphalaria glabrata]|uniref:Uncharacterized protein LOC129921596 isoform X2 n=1 Tax=Biomphalaria glabrata TaxID=6526 RepID=A0A9W3AMF3_BIOGL|nr:uncharacterized protein LOC129921596 isoform X2 [Biomphalaria glabrata]
MPCWSKTWPVIRPELEMSSCANLALLKLLITKIHSKYINYVIQISLSGNAKSQLSLQCSLDMTENLVLNSLNPNLVAAKVSESVKHLINQESVKTKEVITVNTSLDLDTFSKLLPFLRCYFVNEENKLNVEDQATESTKQHQQMSTSANNANTSKTTRLIKTTNPIYSTNADASNTTRLNQTTDPTYSTNADASNTTRLNETTDPTYSTNADGSMEIKILMVISICSTFLIAVALVCTGILIYSWKRVFNVGSGEIIFCI